MTWTDRAIDCVETWLLRCEQVSYFYLAHKNNAECTRWREVLRRLRARKASHVKICKRAAERAYQRYLNAARVSCEAFFADEPSGCEACANADRAHSEWHAALLALGKAMPGAGQ